MIQANELRIGNYVKYGEDTLCIIGLGYRNGIAYARFKDCHYGAWIEDIKPIPLTEEILLKCGGFEHGIEYKLKASALTITFRINAGNVYCEVGNIYLGGRIKYLHELQNLYHAICSKELEVKLC